MGKFAVCSFYATKLLTTGHGGLLAVDNKLLGKKIRTLFTHDKQGTWEPHLHFLMSDFNAALGLSQLKKLGKMIKERTRIAKRFLVAMGDKQGLANSVYSRFLVVTTSDADKIINQFNMAGIEAKKPVFKPLFQYLKLDRKKFPNALWAHQHLISVPLYPGMTESEIEIIETFLEKHSHELRSWPPA